eukprot:gene23255-24638_t
MQKKEGEEQQNSKLEAFRQRKREIQCALNLVVKLQPFIDMEESEQAYIDSLEDEIKELSASPFGRTLVSTIGYAYVEYASSELSSFDSFKVGLSQAGRGISTSITIATEGLQAAYLANQVKKSQAQGGDSADSKSDNSAEGADSKSGSKQEGDLAKKMEKLSGHMFSV